MNRTAARPARAAISPAPLLLAALLLAGCSSGAADTNQPAASNVVRALDAVQNQVIAMPEAARNGVLVRAIRDAQQPCQHVERSEDRGVSGGVAIYVAHCIRGPVYTVTIGPDGNAGVTPGAPAR